MLGKTKNQALQEMRATLTEERQEVFDAIMRQLNARPNRERQAWLLATMKVLPVLKVARLQTVVKTLEEAT